MVIDESKSLNVFPIQIAVVGKDAIIEGEIVRTKGPRTVEKILSKLPVTGKASKRGSQLNFPIGIKMGKEKSTKNAKKGEIGYSPLADAICIFLDDMDDVYGEVNVIGQITSDFDALMNTRLLVTLKISQK